MAAVQLRECVALLPEGLRPRLSADRYYPSAAFVRATADIACGKLLRCKKRRVFYRAAPPPTGKRGAPRKDGERFACHDPSTHGTPWAHWEGEEASGQRIEVDAWEHLPMSKAREVELTVIRVTRFGASDKKRDPRVSWFVWIDQEPAPLEEIRPLYGRRFGMEHTSRFSKQELLWEEPRLRTPEQFERWTQIVAIVHNHLVLARSLIEAKRQPWERPGREVDAPTGSPGHGPNSCHSGNTRCPASSARKIARTSHGSTDFPSRALSGDQKGQTDAKKATEIGIMSFVLCSLGLTSELFPRFS